ncbi:MAG: CARDB domain-containing protein [Thermoplasmataceae archaeon]
MKKIQVLAVFVAIAMIGSAFLAMGSAGATSPQTGSLSFRILFVGGGNSAPANSSTVVMLETPDGHVLSTQYGPTVTFSSLYYGNYSVVVPAQYLPGFYGAPVVLNQSYYPVALDSSTNGKAFTDTLYVSPTYKVNVSVSNIASGSASISFRSVQGFAFKSVSVTETNNYTFVYLPSQYYAVLGYNGATYAFQEFNVGPSVKLDLRSGSPVSGFVSTTNGATLSPVDVTVINGAYHNYTVSTFPGSTFSVYEPSWSGYTLLVSSPGYNVSSYSGSMLTSGKVLDVILQPSNSTVTYNYNLSHNLQYLNLTVKYSITNDTTIPQFANASVGSLYWQLLLDKASSSNIDRYVNSTIVNYTANTFLVNGVYYYISSPLTLSKAVQTFNAGSPPTNGFTAELTAQYKNISSIKTSIYNGAFNINVYAIGSQYQYGKLGYQYNITYNNTGIALNSSSSSNVRLSNSPIIIPAQSSSGLVTLTLQPVKNATVTNSLIQFQIAGKIVNNILNSSQGNTVFASPINSPVTMNVSNAFYNPVTGRDDYQNAIFNWAVVNATGKTTNTSSNIITKFANGNNTIYLNWTSGSGAHGSTMFYVYGSSGKPTVVYNITSQGKTIENNTASSSPVKIFVNQTQTTDYSSYYSHLNLTAGGRTYQVPLSFNWSFPTSVSLSANTSYVFQKPNLTQGYQYIYLNVSSVSGNASIVFVVTVNDTTPPVPVVTIKNPKGQVVNSPIAGQNITLSAASSYDPYYNSTYFSNHPSQSLNYTWKIESASGTVLSPSSTTYTSLYGNSHSMTWNVQFNNVSSVRIVLSVKNPSQISGVSNQTYSMVIDSPYITVNNIYQLSGLQQGISHTIYVNFTNTGTVTANNVTIVVTVGGSQVASKTFTYLNLTPGSSANESLSWTPSSSGSFQIVAAGHANGEPSFMTSLGEMTVSASIATSPYTTPLIIVGVIAVIVVVGFVYYRISSRGSRTTAIKKREDQKKPPQPPEKKK